MPARDDLVMALNASLFAIVRQYDNFRSLFARNEKVSVTELRALSRIVENPTITPKQVASALDLTTGAVTALVDRLVESGLVVRTPHPNDRRSLRLAPTEAGAAMMHKLIRDFEDLLRRSTSGLDDEQLREFSELLAGLVEEGHAIQWE